jgi:NAD(P)-dependent dehydrogenase (short-subunit alcohol dehydrogenase family)
VLVVGASAGIGRAFARHAVAQGADVCVSARRAEKLVELCREAGGGRPVVGDVTDPDDCRRVVGEAVEHLGGLDLVLYTAGAGTMAPIVEADPAAWRRDYEVNVIGPTLVCGAALPALGPHGLMSFISSEASSQTRWGLSSYTASKTALDATIRFWRAEHPERRFQRIVMGATIPTEFGDGFDRDHLTVALQRWAATGVPPTAMETDDVGRQLAEVLGVVLAHPGIDVPDLCLGARGEAWGETERRPRGTA